MTKKLLVKLAITAIISVVAYSIFWFFKAGQLEKYINNFISSNSSELSLASFDVSGYPLQQKVTFRDLRFSLPDSFLGKNKIVVRKAEADSSIFKNIFDIKIVGDVMVFDEENQLNNVEFAQKPRIRVVISKGTISNFSYKDDGYRIFNPSKNVIYSSGSSNINFSSFINENKQISSKISMKIKSIKGFGMIDIYKNSFEKKIIDNIKTGNIKIGSNVEGGFIDDRFAIAADEKIDFDDASRVKTKEEPSEIEKNPEATETTLKKENLVAKNDPEATSIDDESSELEADIEKAQNIPTDLDQEKAKIEKDKIEEALNALIKIEENIKNDLVIEMEYVLTAQNNDADNLSIENSQRIVKTKYNKLFKINNAKISNSLYEISINGQVNHFQDDVTPSGFVSVKIDRVNNFTGFIERGLLKIANDNHSKLNSFDASSSLEISQDAYKDFLRKLAQNLSAVTNEIAEKNQLSQGKTAVFDMRREKNLEFIVNETPFREILGKF